MRDASDEEKHMSGEPAVAVNVPETVSDVKTASALEDIEAPTTATIEHKQEEAWKAPNGGFEAWLQVAAGFFLSMNSWGLVNTFGVYQTYYYTTLLPDTSNSDISWIGSTQGFLLSIATVFAGQACDAGHARLTLLFGATLVVFGLMLTSLCSDYWQLILAQGVCVGLGSGCCFITSVSVLPTYFTTRRALAIGISSSGSSVGGVIYPLIFHQLQPHIGWRWSTRIIGFIALVTLTFSSVALRPRPKPTTARNSGTLSKLHRLFDISAFKDPSFSLFSLAACLSFIGLFIPFFYIEQYSQSQAHLSTTLSFYTLPLLSAGSIAGRILPSIFANRYGALTVLAVCTSISAVLAFAWFGIHDAAGLVVFALVYGLFSGAFVSLRTVVVVFITPEEAKGKLATRLGTNAFCAAIGMLIGTPIAGALVDESNGWDKLRGFCAGTIVCGGCFVGLAAWVARRKPER